MKQFKFSKELLELVYIVSVLCSKKGKTWGKTVNPMLKTVNGGDVVIGTDLRCEYDELMADEHTEEVFYFSNERFSLRINNYAMQCLLYMGKNSSPTAELHIIYTNESSMSKRMSWYKRLLLGKVCKICQKLFLYAMQLEHKRITQGRNREELMYFDIGTGKILYEPKGYTV